MWTVRIALTEFLELNYASLYQGRKLLTKYSTSNCACCIVLNKELHVFDMDFIPFSSIYSLRGIFLPRYSRSGFQCLKISPSTKRKPCS